MHKKHKRGYKFTDKKQSKRGVIAWMLSVISLAVLVAVIVCSFQNRGNGSMYLGSAGVSSMLVGVVALFNAVLFVVFSRGYMAQALTTYMYYIPVSYWLSRLVKSKNE